MKQFEAKSLEEVYELASNEFNCSITELELDVIQQPSNGFLGFGKKNAIVTCELKQQVNNSVKPRSNKFRKNSIKIEDVSKKIADSNEKANRKETQFQDNRNSFKNENRNNNLTDSPKVKAKERIFDKFYNDEKNESKFENSQIVVKKNKNEIVNEVTLKINDLFSDTCFSLEEIKVEFYDEETLYVEFSGADSALLIGKEGYRYKALSYILFNWINESYNLMLRLEVAEFLKNQEIAIHAYLEPVIENIKERGSYKTKPLDGILVHIALKRLRSEFPDKYVAVKTNQKGDKYVLVNEYRSSRDNQAKIQ
ncbi:MAG: Jag N-terminal domain-containing protein [Campylobacteraceae bacterium]|nr:Jag N-terminal domain-containing protein [Campylobacteraceae bacterium]